MATHGRSDIEEARSQAILEIDRTTRDILEMVEAPMKAGAKCGADGAWDASQRAKYIRTLQTNAASFKGQAEAFASAGQLHELRAITEAAVDARNVALNQTRDRITPMAKAFSKHLKEEGKTLAQMLQRKAGHLYGASSYNELGASQKSEVLLKVVDSSGKSSQHANRLAKWIGRAGKVLFVAAVATMVLTVISAQDPALAAGLCIGEFAVGFIGGEMAIAAITGSVTLATALGPAGVFMLAGVAAAGVAIGTYYLFDYLGGLFKKSPKEWTPQSRVMVPFKGAREILGADVGAIFGADVDRFRVDATFWLPSSVLRGDPSALRGNTSVLRGDPSVLRGDPSVLRGDASVLRADKSMFRR